MTGAVTTTLVAAASSGSASEDYEVVELDPGELRAVELGDGETHENVLYDTRANRSQVVFRAHGADWTLRNVGVVGNHEARGPYVSCSVDAGSTGRIENVYFGDGAIDEHRAGLGIWVAPRHGGHLDIERVNIQGMGDNSFYCSAPGGSGTVAIDSCYSKDSWVAHYRLARGSVTNSVAVNTSAGRDGRGLWAWSPGPVEVEGCEFVMNGRHYSFDVGANNSASRVRVTDTQYDTGLGNGTTVNGDIQFASGNGTNPRDRVPEGCPTSAAEAASGSGDGGSERSSPDSGADPSDDREHVLVADGVAGEVTDYELRVDGGPIEPSTHGGATIDDNITVADDGTAATGRVWAGTDAWTFDGDLGELTADGPASFELDGEPIDPDRPEDAHVLVADGVAGEVTDYELRVDGGPIEPSTHGGATIDDNITVADDGTAATGRVWAGTDAWTFVGELEELTADGPATFELDGEPVEPDGPEDAHVLVADGVAGEVTDYELRVDGGPIEPAEYAGATIDDNITVADDGTAATGRVWAGTDAWTFVGELEELTADGPATFELDGEPLEAGGDR